MADIFISFQVDGLLFYKRDVNYSSGVNDQILWIKPYMLPDLFESIAVPKKYMSQKPDTYKNFESFVDDVNDGKIKTKRNKKKKSSRKKEFVPDVELVLPPNEECSKKGDNKQKKQKNKRGNQNGQNVQSSGYRQYGQSSARVSRSRGAVMNNYGRLLAHHGNPGGRGEVDRAIYGKGSLTGYPYYGDDRDFYYPNTSYGVESRGRRDRGRNKDSFQMSEMEAALSYYDNGNPKSNRGKQYHLF